MGERLTDAAIEAMIAENTRLRAALAQSDQPCAYCSLPADEWAKCANGFPGCSRGDDAMGCPHLGAGMESEQLRADLAEAHAALASLVAAWNQLLPLEPTIANMLVNQRRADVRNILLAAVPNLPEIAAAAIERAQEGQ